MTRPASPAPILVLGANGQVGHELARRAGDRLLTALGRADLDITDAAAVADTIAALRPRVVINAAAYTAVDRAETETDLAWAVNAQAPGHLAAACAATGAALVHVSTDYVFDGRPLGRPWQEEDAPAPLGVYGASKLAGETAVRQALAEHVIVRTAWVFGAHGANFVKTILRLAAERDELRIVADQHGSPTPAGALADALLTIADHIRNGGQGWGTVHCGGAPAVSWHGFAEAIVARAAAKGLLARVPNKITAIATADFPTPARRPQWSVLDTARLQATFGIAAPDWQQGLDDVLDTVAAHARTDAQEAT